MALRLVVASFVTFVVSIVAADFDLGERGLKVEDSKCHTKCFTGKDALRRATRKCPEQFEVVSCVKETNAKSTKVPKVKSTKVPTDKTGYACSCVAPSDKDPREKFPLSYDLHAAAFGYDETLAVPLYTITDWTIPAKTGTYSAINSAEQTFSFEILEIKQDSSAIHASFAENNVTLTGDDEAFIQDSNVDFTSFIGVLPNKIKFAGLLVTYDETGETNTIMLILDDDAPAELSRRLAVEIFEWCDNFVEEVIAAKECAPNSALETDGDCIDAAQEFYQNAKEKAEQDYSDAIEEAKSELPRLLKAAKEAARAYRAAQYAVAVVQCVASLLGGPFATAVCIAKAIAIIEATAFAIQKGLELAAKELFELAVENAEALLNAAKREVCARAKDKVEDCLTCKEEDIDSCVNECPEAFEGAQCCTPGAECRCSDDGERLICNDDFNCEPESICC